MTPPSGPLILHLMMKATHREPLHPDLDLLPAIFQQYPGVQAVYLFGSVAAGKTHRESDLDLAVVPRNGRVRAQKLDILANLARHGFCNVDLVFLDTAFSPSFCSTPPKTTSPPPTPPPACPPYSTES